MVPATTKKSQGESHGFNSACGVFLNVVIDPTNRLQASMGDDILNYQPTADQEGIWEAGTHLPFDPFVSSGILMDIDVDCPKCERPINICKSTLMFLRILRDSAESKLAFVNTEETGFAQPDFISVCPHCETLVTRETLGVAKFIRDIVLDLKDPSHVQMHGKGVYLS